MFFSMRDIIFSFFIDCIFFLFFGGGSKARGIALHLHGKEVGSLLRTSQRQKLECPVYRWQVLSMRACYKIAFAQWQVRYCFRPATIYFPMTSFCCIYDLQSFGRAAQSSRRFVSTRRSRMQ